MTPLQLIYRTRYSRKSVLLLVSLFAILLLAVFFFSYSASVKSSRNTPATNLSPATSASQVLTTYYSDIMNAHYESAYTLLSAPVRQQLDPQGGATYLQNELERFATKYGTITSYTITQSHSNTTAKQVTCIVRITRAKLTHQQTETDTYHLVQQDTVWVIDQWTTDVNTQ